jgi:hypothetical protein
MGRGSFFTGEKKKKKKGDGAKALSQAPVFTMPSIIKKGKFDY